MDYINASNEIQENLEHYDLKIFSKDLIIKRLEALDLSPDTLEEIKKELETACNMPNYFNG